MARRKTVEGLLARHGAFDARVVRPDLPVRVLSVSERGVTAEVEVCGEVRPMLFKVGGLRCPKEKRERRKSPLALWVSDQLEASDMDFAGLVEAGDGNLDLSELSGVLSSMSRRGLIQSVRWVEKKVGKRTKRYRVWSAARR